MGNKIVIKLKNNIIMIMIMKGIIMIIQEIKGILIVIIIKWMGKVMMMLIVYMMRTRNNTNKFKIKITKIVKIKLISRITKKHLISIQMISLNNNPSNMNIQHNKCPIVIFKINK